MTIPGRLSGSNESLFMGGYNKGRDDGARQAIAAMKLYFEIYPAGAEYDPASPLLPPTFSQELLKTIHEFADKRWREGQKYERARLKRKAEADAEKESSESA